jgi:hypothetical protein
MEGFPIVPVSIEAYLLKLAPWGGRSWVGQSWVGQSWVGQSWVGQSWPSTSSVRRISAVVSTSRDVRPRYSLRKRGSDVHGHTCPAPLETQSVTASGSSSAPKLSRVKVGHAVPRRGLGHSAGLKSLPALHEPSPTPTSSSVCPRARAEDAPPRKGCATRCGLRDQPMRKPTSAPGLRIRAATSCCHMSADRELSKEKAKLRSSACSDRSRRK